MRLVVDTLIALLLVGLLGSVLWQQGMKHQHTTQVAHVQRALGELYDQSLFYAAMDESGTGQNRAPQYISPIWFGDDLPINILLPTSHPWLDLAPPGDMSDHPPDPVVTRGDQAGFWYNPERRIFRARVPLGLSHVESLRLYNEVNGTSLDALESSDDVHRQPRRNVPIGDDTAQSADGRTRPATRTRVSYTKPKSTRQDSARSK